jgi:hypothetical protein
MSVHHYRGMLAQRTRMDAFRAAISAAVRPGDRVLEVGSGMATYAMFAARAGASRVWAVEGGDIRQVAHHLLRDNGLDDVVELVDGWFPEVTAPEPVELAIYEDYAARLMDGRSWAVLSHIAGGSLAPGGRLLPARARVWIAPVHAPRTLEVVAPFAGASDVLYDLDWESSRDYAANTPLRLPIAPEEVIGAPRLLADVGLLPPPSAAALCGEGAWTFEEAVEVHGIAYWFELEVGAGTWLTNAPGGDPGSWGHLLLPADRAIPVAAGEPLRAEVGFDPGRHGEPGWMRWRIEGPGHAWSAHEFRSFLASSTDLRRLSPDWSPELLSHGRAARRVLALVDGSRSLDEMVHTLLQEGFAGTRVQAEQLVHRTLSGRAR